MACPVGGEQGKWVLLVTQQVHLLCVHSNRNGASQLATPVVKHQHSKAVASVRIGILVQPKVPLPTLQSNSGGAAM